MMRLREEIERAALADFAVLIEGETGAGKEMVARQIHQWSRRRKGPWVAVNCAALVDSLVESELFGIEDRTATGVRGRRGKIEMAHNGTLFLDEVAELSPHVQAKLLRVLQDFVVERVGGQESRRVSARLIVATNRSLGPLVQERVFRQDLFYRVNLLMHPGAAVARAAWGCGRSGAGVSERASGSGDHACLAGGAGGVADLRVAGQRAGVVQRAGGRGRRGRWRVAARRSRFRTCRRC